MRAGGRVDAAVGKFCERLVLAGPEALARAKKLLLRVEGAPITPQLANETAAALAQARAGAQAREGIRSFSRSASLPGNGTRLSALAYGASWAGTIRSSTHAKGNPMNSIVYIVGAIVIIVAILSFLGLG